MGLLDPCTKDGRVIFLLPWQNGTIAGTTDEDCKLTFEPAPSEEGINFILNELRNYFDKDISVRRSDVLSSWCGIRPLVIDPKAKNTESLARNHVINVSDNNLVTISGGKWTTYRQMAQETVDTAIKVGNLLPTNDCLTKGLLLDGSKGWSPLIPKMSLIQDLGIDPKVSHHLSATYGMNAYDVVSNAELSNKKWPILGKKLHENYPYLECEVKYSIKEYACSAVDVISRRIRIAFVNVYATLEILPKIINIMAKELNWNETRKKKEYEDCINFLKTQMGMHLREIPHETLTLTEDEIENFKKQYKILDSKNEGFLTYNRVAEYIRSINNDIKHTELHIIFNEIDMNRNGQIEMHEFIRFMDKIKSGTSNTIHLTKSSIGNLEVDSGHLKKRSGHGADE
ncbi:hypothetical protein A3Q56_05599 [Intoshia linei]|uniref:glycerol-3-phosphate dehydrogenase n=1 Tax=Intoshia linei TaxID=1819745 RepID=A0A177AX68_9BILA|nr:hypothetical protein A3Q56_05599 [Intoshia linei]